MIRTVALATLAASALLLSDACSAANSPAPIVTPTITTQAAPLKSPQDAAFDTLYADVTGHRASLAKLSAADLRSVLDVVVCAHQGDVLAMTQAARAKGVSSADAGYLMGANAAYGYC